MTATPVGPSWLGLAWAAIPMLGVAAVLAWQRLGQVRKLLIAALRLVVQISLLGFVLHAVFAAESPALVVLIAFIMLAAAAAAAGSRQRKGTWALRLEAFAAMGIGTAVAVAVGTRLALHVEPWYEARTLVPIIGMVLGNSLNGVALGAERLDNDLRAERDRVELRLALGASVRQAAGPALRAAVAAALMPTINSMTIAGIVAVPGLMTGQVLAGADVGDALRYQILIYFMITGTVGISTLVLLAARLRRYFTPAQQLRLE